MKLEQAIKRAQEGARAGAIATDIPPAFVAQWLNELAALRAALDYMNTMARCSDPPSCPGEAEVVGVHAVEDAEVGWY